MGKAREPGGGLMSAACGGTPVRGRTPVLSGTAVRGAATTGGRGAAPVRGRAPRPGRAPICGDEGKIGPEAEPDGRNRPVLSDDPSPADREVPGLAPAVRQFGHWPASVGQWPGMGQRGIQGRRGARGGEGSDGPSDVPTPDIAGFVDPLGRPVTRPPTMRFPRPMSGAHLLRNVHPAHRIDLGRSSRCRRCDTSEPLTPRPLVKRTQQDAYRGSTKGGGRWE